MNLRFVFCGDILLGGDVGRLIGASTIGEWVKGVSEVWRRADLFIGNLECPCIVNAKPVESSTPELVFSAPLERLSELARAGFSAVTIANNHILNCGPLGLKETIQGLTRSGIPYTGAGMTLTEATRPAFIPVKGLVVGLVAFCYGPPATRTSPGVAPYDRKTMRNALRSARAGADIVIAALHDGLEYSDVPPSETRSRFRFLAENGADLVIGHHPHVLQGLEWIGDVPVAYSLGNFLFHSSLPHVAERSFRRMAIGLYAPEEIQRNPNKFRNGALLTVNFSNVGRSVEWHPFVQGDDLRPRLCKGNEKSQRLRNLAELSAALVDKKDPRHRIADSVLQTVRKANLRSTRISEILKLFLKPKWRYFPRGIMWLVHRVMSFCR